MAEPNLMAMTGQQASFLAGGQFPYPVPNGLGTVTVQYKEFGVQLNFVPTVLEEDRIRLQVSPDVSSLDYSVGTSVNNFLVPGLNQRRASTTVELCQGETLAIAGLMLVTVGGRSSRISA